MGLPESEVLSGETLTSGVDFPLKLQISARESRKSQIPRPPRATSSKKGLRYRSAAPKIAVPAGGGSTYS